MRHKTDSIPYAGKTQNEDFYLDWTTSKGHLFFVLDFANFFYPNLGLTLQTTLKEIVDGLDKLRGLSTESFLGHLAKELNNFVFTLGRDNCDGKLFCVAAMALFHGDTLYYLTYGDSRINVFTDDKLLLLNGAKYQSRSLISDTKETPPQVRENPEQMGRSLFEAPLTDRVRSFALGDNDIVLIYSDGLEENVTPQRRLSELRTLGNSDLEAICDAMMKISDATDDRTITVIGGPYKPLGDSLIEQVDKAFEKVFDDIDKRFIDVESICKRQDEITSKLNSSLGYLQDNYVPRSELSSLTKQLNSDNSAGKVASLEARIERLESKNGKVKGRAAEGPVVFTLDQSAYDTIREIVSGKTVTESKQTDSAGSSEPNSLIKNKVEHGKSEPEPYFLRLLTNPKTITLSIFILGMLTLWLFQIFHNKFWPERWIARTEGESLVIRRDDYFSAGPVLSVRLQPPVPNINERASSFEELVPLIAKLQQGSASRPEPVASPNRTENTPSVPTETVQTVAVQPGDNLTRLATRYSTTEAKLRDLNPKTKWEKLVAGEQIQVPGTNVNSGNSQN